jgi:hypothetical protein
MVKLPFVEEDLGDNVFIRTFSADTHPEEFKWHWDEQDRIIQAMDSTDWQFQFDNQLPISLNQEIFIKCGEIHRIIQGTSDVRIKIIKHNVEI